MDTRILAGKWNEIEADVLTLVAFEKDGEEAGLAGIVAELDQANGGWVSEAYQSGEFSGKSLEVCLLHRPGGCRAKRVLLIGGGKSRSCDAAFLRKAGGVAVREAKSRRIQNIAFAVPREHMTPEGVQAIAEGAILGSFEADKFKTDRDERKVCKSFTAVAPELSEATQAAFAAGCVIGKAQNFTRDLVNEPGNRLSPSVLSERACAMAAEAGLEFEVLDRERMKQLGMGALLGVAQGSAEPPALIMLRYKPEAAGTSTDHLALIGKGVTFDTGGISIKPSESMEKMKYDMAGGAAVLGAMQAIASLRPPVTVTGFVPAVENMPGSKAQRPGDIVTTLSGKTVEVINTDAEGRMILIDTITYAKRLGCTHLVDAATLTGAIGVALGFVYAGAFANNEEFSARLLAAAKAAGEKMWPLPLDEDYKDLLKNTFADLSNLGGRYGGAISAAYFLKEFAEETPWIHLDIAGTAWVDENKPHLAKGPSGIGVRTFVKLAQNWGSGS